LAARPLVDGLQIAGNIGLIAGLILVAVQIRDSNRIASAEMFSASVDMGVAINTSQLGETPQRSMSKVLYEPDTVTVEDLFVADRVYDAVLRQLVRVHVFDDTGLFGSETVTPRGYVQLHYETFACPYGVAWLDQTLERFSQQGADDQPFFKNLELMRELASANPAGIGMADRQARAARIISRLGK
jgi:hypothetical protein